MNNWASQAATLGIGLRFGLTRGLSPCAYRSLPVASSTRSPLWNLKVERDVASSAGVQSALIARKLIWFHHIKSSKKKRDIKDWSEELDLGGYCKPGFPGVLIFEGEAENVAEYVRRIKRLKWQHLQVRGQEEEAVPGGESVDARRRFAVGVKELPEGGMAELAEICREVDLERLYLTAFKISR